MTHATIRTIARRFLAFHDAEDVAQEVLLKLWIHAHEETRGTPGAQLAAYARNAVIDRLRHLRSRKRLLANATARPTTERADADDIARAWSIARHEPLLFDFHRLGRRGMGPAYGEPRTTLVSRASRAMGRVRGGDTR